jgi:hypothetical protein
MRSVILLAFLASACITEVPDAAEDSMTSSVAERGSAKSIVLTRGQSTIASLGNQTWEPAASYTVQFSIIPSSQFPPQRAGHLIAPTICYAIVKWSVAGQDIQRVISVSNGASLVGVGEGCTIQVYDATNLTGSVSPDPVPTYTVTATVSPGTRGSQVNPPLFIPSTLDKFTGVDCAGALGATPSHATIPIPQNIGATSVQVTILEDSPAAVGVICSQARILGNSVQWDPLVNTDFVPLDPSAINVVINNFTAAQVNYFVVFGIDG